ncbi:MAG TPA: response regulator transcription factor [Blastocatellia bacterium]|nr:response regulator transcription factor [Blastocatellia bacterium]
MKLLVVDDHALIREGLRQTLRRLADDVDILEAANRAAALESAALNPDLDLVLLDLNLPGEVGFSALEALRNQYPELPIVVLSGNDDREIVRGAIERGVLGFVPKSSSNEVMLSAIRLVLSGGVYLPPQILDMRAPASAEKVDRGAQLNLTQRELDVLALMLQGKSNKLISRELGLAEGTVKIHVTAVLKALRVTTRTQAVVAATQMGLSPDKLHAGEIQER